MARLRRPASLLPLLLLLASCAEDTGFLVTVTFDGVAVPEDVDTLQARITSITTGQTASVSAPIADASPQTLTVLPPPSGMVDFNTRFVLIGRSNGRERIRRVVLRPFLVGAFDAFEIALTAACLDVICGAGVDCQPETGRCDGAPPIADAGPGRVDAGAPTLDGGLPGLDGGPPDGGMDDAGPPTERPPVREGFESDGDGVRYSVADQRFFDGMDDYFQELTNDDVRTEGVYTGAEGTRFFAAEDTDDVGEALKTVTLNPVDIVGFTDVEVSLLVGAGRTGGAGASAYDLTDRLDVEFRLDGGPWTPGLCFRWEGPSSGVSDRSNEPLALDTDCDGTGEGSRLGPALQRFAFAVGTGAALEVRVVVSMNAGDEEIAFDDIRVEGTPP
jgi:hypothetical protein